MLGLTLADGLEIEIRSDLNDKIIEVVRKRGLTYSEVARLAHTSRTRVTAILNRNTQDISTDVMLRANPDYYNRLVSDSFFLNLLVPSNQLTGQAMPR